MPVNLLKIKQLIKRRGFTYKEFAKEINVSEQTIVNWLKGHVKLSIDALEKIAAYFDVPISYFFDEGGNISGSIVNNGNISNNNVGSIQITLAKKENEIELLKTKLEACEKENATLRELIDVLKERCK